MQSLGTSDYRGHFWPVTKEDEEDGYPLYAIYSDSVALTDHIPSAL